MRIILKPSGIGLLLGVFILLLTTSVIAVKRTANVQRPSVDTTPVGFVAVGPSSVATK